MSAEKPEDVVYEMGKNKEGHNRGSTSGQEQVHFSLRNLSIEERDALAAAFEMAKKPEIAAKIRATAPTKDAKSTAKRVFDRPIYLGDALIVGGILVVSLAVWETVRYFLRNKFPNMPGLINRRPDAKVIPLKSVANR